MGNGIAKILPGISEDGSYCLRCGSFDMTTMGASLSCRACDNRKQKAPVGWVHVDAEELRAAIGCCAELAEGETARKWETGVHIQWHSWAVTVGSARPEWGALAVDLTGAAGIDGGFVLPRHGARALVAAYRKSAKENGHGAGFPLATLAVYESGRVTLADGIAQGVVEGAQKALVPADRTEARGLTARSPEYPSAILETALVHAGMVCQATELGGRENVSGLVLDGHRVSGTDGYRLQFSILPSALAPLSKGKAPVLVAHTPALAWVDAVHALGIDAEAEVRAELTEQGLLLYVCWRGVAVSARCARLAGVPPDLMRVVPAYEKAAKCEVQTKALDKALRGLKAGAVAKLLYDGKALEVRTLAAELEGSDASWTRHLLPAAHGTPPGKGLDGRTGFDARYLGEATDALRDATLVFCMPIHDDAPLLVGTKGAFPRFAVVMPRRVEAARMGKARAA